jgi:hypothetical protein
VNKIFKVLSLFASPTMNGNELIYSWVTVFFTAALYCMKKIKLTQVLYSMNHKSIIRLISFLLISMFYVASASAGPTYLNVEMPKECGTWKVSPGAQHCSVRGPSSGKGGKMYFKCVGGGNGKGGVGIDTKNCGRIIFSTAVSCGRCGDKTLHKTFVAHGHGHATAINVTARKWDSQNTHSWVVSKP